MSWIITGREAGPADPYIGNVSLLLHGDGANGSTTIVDSSPSPKTVTVFGDAQISTAQSKFGGSSLVFDGTGDYVEAASSAEFALGTGDFTLELWYYHISGTDTGICANNSGASAGINFTVTPFSNFRAYIGTSGFNIFDSSSGPTASTWQHLALVRSSGALTLYIDGTAAGTADWTGVNAGNTATFSVGSAFGNARFTNGYIDDFRITKGIARYTANFTPPTAPFPDI
jgi:hypothetical protein